MKSYVKEFKYTGKDGEVKDRRLFVMRETDSAVDGIELTYLSEDEQKEVVEHLKDHDVKDSFLKGDKIEGYDPAWGRAWRRYNKCNFIVDEES